jgi:hypothetical protein
VTLDHMDHVCFLSLVYILACMLLILIPKHYIFRIWVYTWLVMLSHTIMSVMQVFNLYDVEFCFCLSVRDIVTHHSRCDWTVVRIDAVISAMVGMVEMVDTLMACGA